MEYEDYKRAKQLQEETLPGFERLKKAVSVGTLDKKAIKEIGDSMDKKKVEELIEKTIRFTKVTDDDYIQGNVKSHIINTLQVALKEISKSDWVSIEDELPPYDKVVWVTSKMSPDNVFKNRRVESTTVPKDDNDFIILWEGRMACITHWKPIDKLED